LSSEFTSKFSHKKGVLSMARAANIDSADSQFFIVLEDSPFLDGQYTIFGYVISGMEFVDMIKKGDKNKNGIVKKPDSIIKMSIASDSLNNKN
jgi:peptidylprolyl isomerase